jgi:hypothetical protein
MTLMKAESEKKTLGFQLWLPAALLAAIFEI